MELANLPADAPRMKQYAQQLRVSSSELHAAIGFFIRQVFLAPGADHYRVLGLSPGADTGRIREHYRKLIGRFHPDRLQGRDEWYGNYSVRINQAYTVLRNPNKRRSYDTDLRQRARSDRHRSRPPAQSGRVRSIRPLSRRTWRSPLRTVFASPRSAWQSIKTYASMRLRWRRKTIDLHNPKSLWRRLGLILSVAAIGGCLAFLLNTLVSLHPPSFVNTMRGDRPPRTSPQPASRAASEANTRSGVRHLASVPELPPSNPAATGVSTDDGAKTRPLANARRTTIPARDDPRTAAARQRVNAPAEHRAPADEAPTSAAAKSRPRSRSRTVPTVEDNAMAPPQPTDRHDSASTPTASSKPEQSRQPPAADILSRPEADHLLARFLRAYESGSITGFMRLFAAPARTEYRAEYAQLFASATTRRIIFEDFRWQLLGSNGTGEGRFLVMAQRKGETTPSIIRGRLMLQIRKSRQGVLITELLHTHR